LSVFVARHFGVKRSTIASYTQQLHSISVNHSPNPTPNLTLHMSVQGYFFRVHAVAHRGSIQHVTSHQIKAGAEHPRTSRPGGDGVKGPTTV